MMTKLKLNESICAHNIYVVANIFQFQLFVVSQEKKKSPRLNELVA